MFTNLFYRDFNLLIGNTIHCEPEWSWVSHVNRWRGYHLWYVLKGGASIKVRNEIHQLVPGDVFLFNLTDNHFCSHHPSNPLSVLTLYFLDNDSDDVLSSTKITPKDSLFMKNLFEQTINTFNQGKKYPSLLWLRALLTYCQQNQNNIANNPLSDLISTIHQQPFTHYSLDELAKKSGYSKNHFIRLFKKSTGLSPLSYCIKVKIDQSKHLLLYTNYSIAKIADITGFSDVSYFSKQFKQTTGISPLSYRNSSFTLTK